MDYRAIEQRIVKSLDLQKRPVAVKFMDAQPSGIEKFAGTEPSGCSFWRLAAAGRTFYTVPSDHYNCPIGSYTHNIPLPPDRAKELEQTLGLMVQIGYLKMEEVPGIPRAPRTPEAVVYAPLGETPVEPDVIIFSGLASQIMILQEAANRAGVAAQFPVLGRPTCMALPASMAQGSVVSSGCIGNRVYTGLGEGEMYVVVRAKDVDSISLEAETVVGANRQLEQYHQSRRESLASA
ncbi:MAG TPA: DUF169 domain-containing protein [Candidatus Acidoferrum sp.]|nr:DUF169 domain-containing protein [Candidatus Acidoferrum sp.]